MFGKINETIKSYKNKIDLKVILILILLIVIGILLFNQNKKIDRLYRNADSVQIEGIDIPRLRKLEERPHKEFIGKIRGDFFENLDKDMKEMDSIKQRIKNEMDFYFNSDKSLSSKEAKSGNDLTIKKDNNIINLETKENYNVKEKLFTLEISLPKGSKKEDLKVSLSNSILYLEISKSETITGDKIKSKDSFSSIKILTIPETKATTKDIRKNFNNGTVTIIVPII